jgi:hypothetical protein
MVSTVGLMEQVEHPVFVAVRLSVAVIPCGTGESSDTRQDTVEPFCSAGGVHTADTELGAIGIITLPVIVCPRPVTEIPTFNPAL